ncbi:ATP-binding protein [Neomicrococcus lactis]
MDHLKKFFRQISLRSKLVALMSGLMILGIVATAWGTSYTLQSTLMQQIDSDLAANSGPLMNSMLQLNQQNSSSTQPSNTDTVRLLRFNGSIRTPDGSVYYALPTASQADTPQIPALTLAQVQELENRSLDIPGTASGSDGWRMKAFALADNSGYMTIALPLNQAKDTIEQATASIMFTGMLSTLIMSMIAYGATSRAFRPLIRVERTAAAIAAGDLSRRVEDFPPETEVGRLSHSLNAMLAHIEQAFRGRAMSERKMRQFIQDASHELRTPLVTIRGYSELYRQGGIKEPEHIAQAMGRIENEAKRMGQLVEDLLTLARLDEQRPLDVTPVDLLLLASDAVEDAKVSAPDRVVRLIGIDEGPPRSAPTRGDEARLRQVVANLMTNAMRYTPAGSPIEVAVGVLPVIDGRSDSVLAIRDHGPGISEADAKRVFERFYRADTSRQRETGGTGLGLAIVAAIAAQHDGSVRLTNTVGGGATMSIHLPHVPFEPLDGPESDMDDDDGSTLETSNVKDPDAEKSSTPENNGARGIISWTKDKGSKK